MENQGMHAQPPQQPVNPMGYAKPPLPNATAVLVLGILSIVFILCYGIGLILGIIALAIMGRSITLYRENPGYYSESSYKNLHAGKVCAIIGTSLSALFIVYVVVILMIVGTAAIDILKLG